MSVKDQPVERLVETDRKPDTNDVTALRNNSPHPLADLAGSFAGDPLWEEFQEAIREYRAGIDR